MSYLYVRLFLAAGAVGWWHCNRPAPLDGLLGGDYLVGAGGNPREWTPPASSGDGLSAMVSRGCHLFRKEKQMSFTKMIPMLVLVWLAFNTRFISCLGTNAFISDAIPFVTVMGSVPGGLHFMTGNERKMAHFATGMICQ